jgi:tetratricopeptide (TPR) repeat protein
MSGGMAARLLMERGGHKEAEPLLYQSIALYQKLLADSPTDRDYRRFLANSRTRLGELLAQTGRTADAEQEYGRALLLREELAAQDPTIEAYQRDLARTRRKIGDLLYQARRYTEAAHEYRQAISALSELTDAESRHWLAWSLATIPDARLRNPQTAVQAAKSAVGQKPQFSDYWNTLGVANYRAGEWNGAIEALQKSKQLRAGGNPSGWFFHAMACAQLGEKVEARSSYRKGVNWMETNNPRDDELCRFRAEAAALLDAVDREKPTAKKEATGKQRQTL